MKTEPNTEQTERLRRAVRELGDAVPVPAIGPAALRAAARRQHPRPRPATARWLPALAGVATVLIVAAVGLLPAVMPTRDARPGASAAGVVLPRTFADHSYLTAHVSDAPAGAAVALYSYGIGDAPWQTPQVLLVGANGRDYRELDVAADRGGGRNEFWQRRSASTLLSPDGTKVAVGRTATDSADDIAIVDLITGKSRRYPVGRGSAMELLAWSLDSSHLLYLAGPYQVDSYGDPRPALARDGEPVLLDVASGTLTTIPGQRGTVDAAFAPDGGRLALQRDGELRIVRLDGTLERTGAGPARHRLAGAAAWSPDGNRLALYMMGESGVPGTPAPVYGLRGEGFVEALAVLDLASDATSQVDGDVDTLLGWRDDQLLVDRWHKIAEVPVGGGPGEVVATLQPGDDHFIADIQLATALLPDLDVRDTGVDRGPWPTWLRLLVVAGALGAGYLVIRLGRIRFGRTARRRPDADR